MNKSENKSELREKILEKIENLPKKVILVEGKEDEDAYTHLFEKKYGNWENLLLVFPVGGKFKVINELERSSDFIGIIDKDEWSEEDILNYSRRLKNLIVIPRYCMESYLVSPGETWNALPENVRRDVAEEDFKNAVLENIDDWIRHAALWRAVCPLYSILGEAGFNKILLTEIEKIKEESFIKETLTKWHDILDPENTLKKYRSLLATISRAGLQEQLQKWIHGKMFWEMHVSKKLVAFFGQKDRSKYANLIWKHRSIPGDWDEIWEKITAFQPKLKNKSQ